MAEIRLENLQKSFGSGKAQTTAVANLNERFSSSSVTCLLGPSGCGKTTLMRMIAGLEQPSSGEIFFDEERVTDLSPSARNIGMVFQYPVVYRGMDVFGNVELPLKEVKGLKRKARRLRVEEVLESLELGHYARRSVDQLDNGTLQKVAVARALARRPRIILFDEPITNVDAESRVQLKIALKRLSRQHSQTIVYVTHDQTEAMTLADDIALMRDGRFMQRGTPDEVYDSPQTRFGGWFLGNPGMNFVPHDVVDGQLQAPLFSSARSVSTSEATLLVGVRPERLQVLSEARPDAVPAKIMHRAIVIGGQHLLTLQVNGQRVKAKVGSCDLLAGQSVWLYVPPESAMLFNTDGQRLPTTFVIDH